MSEAKIKLSKLIAEGQEVIITRYGKPVARLVPIRRKQLNRKPGSAKGEFEAPDELHELSPEESLDRYGI